MTKPPSARAERRRIAMLVLAVAAVALVMIAVLWPRAAPEQPPVDAPGSSQMPGSAARPPAVEPPGPWGITPPGPRPQP